MQDSQFLFSKMKKNVYQLLVYLTLLWTVAALAGFIVVMAIDQTFSGLAILCLVLFVLGIILFVLNQVLYRRFKERDESIYEQVECQYCHTMNSKKELFCKKCGKRIH